MYVFILEGVRKRKEVIHVSLSIVPTVNFLKPPTVCSGNLKKWNSVHFWYLKP
jgi:hypothetical protein